MIKISNLFIPRTFLGKLSIVLIILSLVFFFIFFIFFIILIPILAIGRNLTTEDFFGVLPLAIPELLGMICGISAFFTGLISIVKKKERCIFVYLSTLIGMIVTILSLKEILGYF